MLYSPAWLRGGWGHGCPPWSLEIHDLSPQVNADVTSWQMEGRKLREHLLPTHLAKGDVEPAYDDGPVGLFDDELASLNEALCIDIGGPRCAAWRGHGPKVWGHADVRIALGVDREL